MIRFALAMVSVLALAISADAAPRRASGCTGDNCPAINAALHPFQTFGNVVEHVVRHPQKLPEGPVQAAPSVPSQPAAASCGCGVSAATVSTRQGRHLFPIFSGRQARGGGCGCGR